MPVCTATRLFVPESYAAGFLRVPVTQRPRRASASGPRQLRALPATCPRDPPGLGEGAPTLSGRALVQAGSRPHLAGGRHGQDRTGQGTRAPPVSPGGRRAATRPRVPRARVPPARPASRRRRPAPPVPRARYGTCCVLKSQPRQQGRAGCSAMAAKGPGARPSVLPTAAVSPRSSAQRRRARPSPRPAGLPDPCHPRACALAPPAGRRDGNERPAGPLPSLRATRQGPPCTALCPHPSPAQLPSHMCSLHRSCPNAAWLPAEEVWARDCTFNLA